jgi:methionyl-tRNA synthetase
MRRILVTSALPYTNGHIHIGHLVEYLQTDIWVRFQKLRGRRCIYICADDTHGTATMMRARKEGVPEEKLIAEMQKAHEAHFAGFGIEFDNYGSTNSEENREVCAQIWAEIRKAGLVEERQVTQLYDPKAGTFLADRFVKGTCPNPACRAPDQYGDSCEKCGAHYNATELIDPVSTLSDGKPEIRQADHLFVNIEKLHGFLEEWTQGGEHLQPEIANYLKGHFLCEPLHDWDVSRPAPYFGFEIPDSPGNYWYVWFDAPIGYVASTLQWCKREGEKLDDWWRDEQQTEIHHFIGKDITYFHTLFWPAMLKTGGLSLPEKVHIHGFLTVDGEKMSKRRGTFIRASTYLEHLDPAYLRYYYASKLSTAVDDIDLNFEDLINKVNSDLVGKVVNIASRTARFVEKTGLADELEGRDLFEQAARDGAEIADAYDKCDYSRAMRIVMAAADRANGYIESRRPWELVKKKDDPQAKRDAQVACTTGLNLFRQLAVYLAPVLPRMAKQAGELLNDPITTWEQSQRPLLGTPVGKFAHMMQRVDPKKVEAMVAASAEPEGAETPAVSVPFDTDGPLLAEPLAETVSFDEFAKVDLRVVRVVEAEDVAGAQKLLKLTLSLGGDERRTVFAGIKGVYKPEDLVGRLVICVANLAPRKMKFGMSEGMIVAAGGGGGEIYVLSPDAGAKPGQRVH